MKNRRLGHLDWVFSNCVLGVGHLEMRTRNGSSWIAYSDLGLFESIYADLGTRKVITRTDTRLVHRNFDFRLAATSVSRSYGCEKRSSLYSDGWRN